MRNQLQTYRIMVKACISTCLYREVGKAMCLYREVDYMVGRRKPLPRSRCSSQVKEAFTEKSLAQESLYREVAKTCICREVGRAHLAFTEKSSPAEK